MSSICLVLLLCALAKGYPSESPHSAGDGHHHHVGWDHGFVPSGAPQAAGRSGDVARAHGFVPSGASQAAVRSGDAAGAHGSGASGAPHAARRAGDEVESHRFGASGSHQAVDRSGDAAKVHGLVASGAPQAAGRAGDEDESHGSGASGAPQVAAREGDAAGVPDSNAQRSDSQSSAAQDAQSEGNDNASRASPFLLQERGRPRYRYNNRGFGKGNYYPSHPKYQRYIPHGGRHYYFPRNGEDAEGNEAVAGDYSAESSPNAAAGRTSSGVDERVGCCGGEAEREGASGYYNGPGGYVYGAASRHGAGPSKQSAGADAEPES